MSATESRAIYRLQHLEQDRQKSRDYAAANSEKARLRAAEWHKNNRARALDGMRSRYERKRDGGFISKKERTDRDRARDLAYRLAHREEIQSRLRQYRGEVKAGRPVKRRSDPRPDRRLPPEEKRRRARLYGIKHRYGLTADQYFSMVAAQENRCAICGKEARRLDVDHDHLTEAVRGLLCQRCNMLLGVLESAPSWITKAMAYLCRHEEAT